MIEMTTPPSPFREGDLVQPKETADLALLLTGKRTPPGPVTAILGFGAHMVRQPDGREYPYGSHELEKVST